MAAMAEPTVFSFTPPEVCASSKSVMLQLDGMNLRGIYNIFSPKLKASKINPGDFRQFGNIEWPSNLTRRRQLISLDVSDKLSAGESIPIYLVGDDQSVANVLLPVVDCAVKKNSSASNATKTNTPNAASSGTVTINIGNGATSSKDGGASGTAAAGKTTAVPAAHP